MPKKKKQNSTTTTPGPTLTIKKKKKSSYNPGTPVQWQGMIGRAQPGWETATVTLRPNRSFQGQRESQVMRHVSRQLFPFLKAKKSNPIEIQMMWANGSVFIGTNKDTPTKRLAAVLADIDELDDAMTRIWGKTGELHDRSKRAVAKLKRLEELVLGDVDDGVLDVDGLVDLASCMEAQELYRILVTQRPEELHCKDDDAATLALDPSTSGSLYYVIEGNNRGRHIEEKFIDVLEGASYGGDATIAGVKRPCGTCWLRLQKAKDNGYRVNFSPYPGQIWKAQAETLGLPVSEVTKYVKKGTHRSEYGGKDFDSGSDTEGEDDLF